MTFVIKRSMIAEKQHIFTLPAETSALSTKCRLAEGNFIAGAKPLPVNLGRNPALFAIALETARDS